MNNNPWNQSYNGNQVAENNNLRRTSGLIQDYGPKQEGSQQYSPSPMLPPEGPPPYSPMPPQQWGPREQQSWVANTMQMVRRWSGGMSAVSGNVEQQPLVLRRPSNPLPPAKSKPWK